MCRSGNGGSRVGRERKRRDYRLEYIILTLLYPQPKACMDNNQTFRNIFST